jgi:Family of unknown function (DUF6499)
MREGWGMGEAYSYVDGLEPKEAGWEFFRRNPEYRSVYRFIVGGFATLFAQRWNCVVDPDLRADHALFPVGAGGIGIEEPQIGSKCRSGRSNGTASMAPDQSSARSVAASFMRSMMF